MQTVYRDIPGLLTSRDTIICRLKIVHGIVANFADRINSPQPYDSAQLATCKKLSRKISHCSARNQHRKKNNSCIAHNVLYIFSSSKILSLYMHLISVNDYLDFNYKALHESGSNTGNTAVSL